MAPYESLRDMIEKELSAAIARLGYGESDISNSIGMSEVADISCSAAFRIAKEQRKSPDAVASEIAAKLNSIPGIKKVLAEKGFINFYIERRSFAKDVVDQFLAVEERSAESGMGGGAKKIVEYPSANPVHPLHIGQLRNAILGDAVSNIYEKCGYSVEREDYIDDLGLQVAEALWGIMHLDALGMKEDPSRKFDHWLGEVYVEVNKRLEKDKGIEPQVKEVLRLMEQGGTHESVLAREMASNHLNAEYQTLFDFNMYHDVLVWESDIVRERLVQRALDALKRKDMIKEPRDGKYSGCVIIDISDLKRLPRELQGLREDAKVLIRSDGTPNYIGKDIAFHMWKFGMLPNTFKYRWFMEKQPNGRPLYTTSQEGETMDFGGASGTINTIDTRQSYEQLLIKVVFDSMGEEERAKGLKHLAYGVVELEGAPLAGRKGTWIGYTADDLLREATDKARTLIKKRFKLGEKEEGRIAKSVGISAIKFEFLKVSPERRITFSWERALNFEGNSGPYCQYTHARACRILEKAGQAGGEMDPSAFDEDATFCLIKQMSRCTDIVQKAAREYRPNVITDYLLELSSAFSRFYETVPVLKGENAGITAARLAVVSSFRHVIAGMLGILGIEAIERM